jgi:hypothetical protein
LPGLAQNKLSRPTAIDGDISLNLFMSLIPWLVVIWLYGVSACGEETNNVEFQKLAQMADRYELPAPPEKAELVLAYTGQLTWADRGVVFFTDPPPGREKTQSLNKFFVSDNEERLESGNGEGTFLPAFKLADLPNGRACVFYVWSTKTCYPIGKRIPATKPFSVDRKEFGPISPDEGMAFDPLCWIEESPVELLTAVQMTRAGFAKQAREYWHAIQEIYAETEDSQAINETNGLANDLQASREKTLVFCIYSFYYDSYRCQRVPDEKILAKLEALRNEYPQILQEFSGADVFSWGPEFIDSLKYSLTVKDEPMGRVEAALVKTAGHSPSPLGLYPDDDNYAETLSTREIYSGGLSAIKELIALRSSRRVLHGCEEQLGFSSGPPTPPLVISVSRLARQKLLEMTGPLADRDVRKLKEWQGDEAEFFQDLLSNIAVLDGGTSRLVAPIWILENKYPDILIKLCLEQTNVPLANCNFRALVEAVAHANVTNAAKVEALSHLYDRSPGILKKVQALHGLCRVDDAQISDRLAECLNHPFNDVREIQSSAVSYLLADVVNKTNRPEHWKAYLEATQRAKGMMKASLLASLTQIDRKVLNQEMALAIYRELLRDTSRIDMPSWSISVQDHVAGLAAEMLDLETKLWPELTLDERQSLRKQVEQELSQMNLPKF